MDGLKENTFPLRQTRVHPALSGRTEVQAHGLALHQREQSARDAKEPKEEEAPGTEIHPTPEGHASSRGLQGGRRRISPRYKSKRNKDSTTHAGAYAGGATCAVLGLVAGPVGAVVGAAIGAAAGAIFDSTPRAPSESHNNPRAKQPGIRR